MPKGRAMLPCYQLRRRDGCRFYEDLLGVRHGGSDGRGHLGYAAARGLSTFGHDVFGRVRSDAE